MPQVEREIVKARAARLRAKAEVRRSAWLDGLVGTRQRVLVENERGHGHGASNAPVRLNGAAKGSNPRRDHHRARRQPVDRDMFE